MIAEWSKQRRRQRLLSQPFPKNWRRIIERNMAVFHRLSARDQAELLGHVQVFLAEKRFEGCGELELTDEIAVTIAAQACLLLLHRKTDYFPDLLTILVYPSTYLVEEKRHVEGPVWEEGTMHRQGETGHRMGSMVLAWDVAKAGAMDGAPAFASQEQQLSWSEVMRTEFASLRSAEDIGMPTLLDTYGASNPAEFFAVATEAFFERPRALRTRHPKLYAELERYFHQNPIEYSQERVET